MIVNSSRFNFKELVDKYMSDYRDEVIYYLSESIFKAANKAAKKLRNESPKGATGKYAKGWAVKKENGRLRVVATVYGKDGTYQLAHLLEKGHAKRGGGRVAAIEHIRPVEEWAQDEAINIFLDKMESIH